MRIENSLKNSSASFIGQAISLAVGFLARTVFIHILGDEYLGLNGLFTSILSLLSLVELGLGTAVSFALYKPIAEKDTIKIVALMRFFKIAYRYVAVITAVLGVGFLPFLRFIANDGNNNIKNLNLIYFMFLLNNVFSYFFSYNKILISANQKNYINTVAESFFMFLQYILQIIVIAFLKNYIVYLSMQLLCIFMCNVYIFQKAYRMYPFLKEFRNAKLDKTSFKELKENLYALLIHRISGIVVTGTDNLLIAQISVIVLGYYTNYTYVITTIATVFAQIFGAVSASVGNLIVTEIEQKQEEIYINLNFIAFWMYGVLTIVIAHVIKPFITLWAGETRVLPMDTVYLMLINFFLNGMKQPNTLVINASGLFKQMRVKSIFEAVINLFVSLVLLLQFKMGLLGVLLGTTVSFMLTNFWWDAFVIYKNLFKKSCIKYFIQYAKYILIILVSFIVTKLICQNIIADTWQKLFFTGIISFLIPNILFLIFTYRMNEFKFVKSLLVFLQKKVCLKQEKVVIYMEKVGLSEQFFDSTYVNNKRIYLLVKRMFDILFGCIMLIISSPLLLIITLAIRIFDGSGVIFKQNRVGISGKEFIIYKLRTMKNQSDPIESQMTPEEYEKYKQNYKLDHDRRVTKLGAFLRKSSLDEMPQLLNVIKGDMSIIGPRPVLQEETERYGLKRDLLLSIRPGLTGYWQVNGRSDTTYQERIDMELYYCEHFSFILDLKIILKTFIYVITGKGAR